MKMLGRSYLRKSSKAVRTNEDNNVFGNTEASRPVIRK